MRFLVFWVCNGGQLARFSTLVGYFSVAGIGIICSAWIPRANACFRARSLRKCESIFPRSMYSREVMLLPFTWFFFVLSSDGLFSEAARIGSSTYSSNTALEKPPLPRVYCRSRIAGPLPPIVDCVPTLYHMSMSPGAFLPHKYSRGDTQEWDGTSGIGYCKVSLYGGQNLEYFSNDDLLELVLFMIGKCYPPGNGDRVSEALTVIGVQGNWRLQFSMRMATNSELQAAGNRSSQFALDNKPPDRESMAEQR